MPGWIRNAGRMEELFFLAHRLLYWETLPAPVRFPSHAVFHGVKAASFYGADKPSPANVLANLKTPRDFQRKWLAWH